MSYKVLRSRWFNIIVLNVHESSEEKCDDSKDSFYEELEQVFFKYHVKILVEDSNAKLGRGGILRPKIGNENVHQDNNVNGVRKVNFDTLKILVVKSTMFLHQNVHVYSCISPDGKTHNQTDHLLIDRRCYSYVLFQGS